MLPWQFFSASLSAASQSVVTNSNLISKVYFPRMIIPAGAVITAFVDFMISFIIMVGMMGWFHFWPSWRLLTLPLFMGVAFFAALGPGLLLTALTVRYRDVRFIIPFIVQFGLYVSPVGFSTLVVPDKWRIFYALNPMVGVVEGFRWALLGTHTAPGPIIAVSASAALLILVTGAFYFRRMEKTFADIV